MANTAHMYQPASVLALALCALLAGPAPAASQVAEARRVVFLVTDAHGMGVSDAVVTVRDSTGVLAREQATRASGEATFHLPLGTYAYSIAVRGIDVAKGQVDVGDAGVLALSKQPGILVNSPVPGLPASDRFNLNDINYFSTGPDGRRPTALADTYASQVKFRVSIRYKLSNLPLTKDAVAGVYATYAQQSLWNIRDESAPFFDNNYRPGVFLYTPEITGAARAYAGVMHESNGREEPQSRGWNRLFGGITVGRVNHSRVSGGATVWHAFGLEQNNMTLRDYAGRGEAEVYVQPFATKGEPGLVTVHARTRLAGKSLITNAELNLLLQPSSLPSFHWLSAAIHAQLFRGYAETLRVFDHRHTSFRLGLALFR